MNNDSAPESVELPEAVSLCRQKADFRADLAELYAQVDAEVAARGAICHGDGRCCKFDLFGHRLYVSCGELAVLCEQAPKSKQALPLRCPYQIDTRCTARYRRPLGCRVFFCSDTLNQWCEQTYERFHNRIRRLHDHYALSYAYVELTVALKELFSDSEEE